jgi:hypothetical protein
VKWPGSEGQKLHVLPHVWTTDLIQTQQCYEKLVMVRGGRVQEGEGKRTKLRSWIWLIHSLYKNEYRILKLAETTVRKGLR